jgi:hypothetical protein
MTNRTKYQIIALLVPFAIALLSSCELHKNLSDDLDKDFPLTGKVGKYTIDLPEEIGVKENAFNMGAVKLGDTINVFFEQLIDPREYQIELNQDGSADIYDGSRHVGHLDYKQGECFSKLILKDNQ